jgi:hypothetical protein
MENLIESQPEKLENLNQVLQVLPEDFTSHQFLKIARNHGILPKDRKLELDVTKSFLTKKANSVSRFKWKKKILPEEVSLKEIQGAIDLLKENGYRVLKPVMDYQEI